MHDTAPKDTAAQIYPDPPAIAKDCRDVVEDHLAHGIIGTDIKHINEAQRSGADKAPDRGVPFFL